MLSGFEQSLSTSGMTFEVLDAIHEILNYRPEICLQFTNPEIEELNQVFPFAPSAQDGKFYHKECRNQLKLYLAMYPTFRATSKQKIGRKIWACFSQNPDLKSIDFNHSFH